MPLGGVVSEFEDNNVFDFGLLHADIPLRSQSPKTSIVLRHWRLYKCRIDLNIRVMNKLNP